MRYKIFRRSAGYSFDAQDPVTYPKPPGPTYSISPDITSVNEGSSVTWTVTTTNFGTGTLYWTNSGTAVGADFNDATNSGSISIVNNTGTFTKTLTNDVTTEGSQTIIIQLRLDSISGTIVATSDTVNVIDTSLSPPTYAISPDITSVNEGSSVTWTVTTTNFGTGTLYWTNSGTTVGADFDGGTNFGSISIVNDTGTLTKTLTNDLTTEGPETIIIQLRTGSTGGTIVATSDTVTVNDTSITPPPTYAISPDITSVNEGSSVTWTVTTTNFGTGTLYWTNSGTTSSVDSSDATNSGSISIVNDTGTLTKTLISDLSTEGPETIIIQLRTGSTGGTIVATSATVTVNDTSVTYVPSPVLVLDSSGFTPVTGTESSPIAGSWVDSIGGRSFTVFGTPSQSSSSGGLVTFNGGYARYSGTPISLTNGWTLFTVATMNSRGSFLITEGYVTNSTWYRFFHGDATNSGTGAVQGGLYWPQYGGFESTSANWRLSNIITPSGQMVLTTTLNRSNSVLKQYSGGSLLSSTTLTGTDYSSDATNPRPIIIANNARLTATLNCTIKTIRLYNTVLNDAQVAAIATQYG